MSTSASIGGTSTPVTSLAGCYATPPVTAPYFAAFPATLAGWQYSDDGGRTFVAAVATQAHVATTSGLRQWRYSFNVPEALPNAVTRDQLRIILTGDIFNAGDLVGGQLYLDGSRIAANTGTDGAFTSEWVSSLGSGPHTLIWIEGASTIAGNTAPLFSAQIRTTQPVRIVDTIIDNGTLITVETDIFNIANVLIPRVANDQLVFGDCDEASGERAASVVKQCADVGRGVVVFGPELLTNGDLALSSGIGATSVAGPGWTSGYAPSGQIYTSGANSYGFFNTNGGQLTGNSPIATPLAALTGRSMAVNVGPNPAIAIMSWANVYLSKGSTYTLECDAGVISFPFGVAIQVDGVMQVAVTAPAVASVWTKTQSTFTFTGTSGYKTVSLNSNNTAPGGNDHVFDNISLRQSSIATTEARKPAAFEQVVGVVVDQIVETTNCNDDRRDIILAEISKATQRITVNATSIAVSATQIANATFNLPANVRSFTVTSQTGTFDLSFNNGTAYTLTAREGSRTWGIADGLPIAGSDQIRIRSPNVGSLVDVIWEV